MGMDGMGLAGDGGGPDVLDFFSLSVLCFGRDGCGWVEFSGWGG